MIFKLAHRHLFTATNRVIASGWTNRGIYIFFADLHLVEVGQQVRGV